jgi:hypothetical protein
MSVPLLEDFFRVQRLFYLKFIIFMSSQLRYGLILCGIAALLLTPLLFFGLDYTDTGYSTAMAWLQAAHPKAALWDFNNFGSAFLAGFWFFTGADSLLAYRFQWELMIIATAACAYWALTFFYDDHRAIMFALVPTLVLAVFNSEEGLVAEYHNLPPFLCALSAALFLRFFATTPKNNTDNNTLSEQQTILFMLGSGIVAAFMVFARLPMLLWCAAVYAMLAFAWLRGIEKNSPAQGMMRLAGLLMLGFLLGAAACVGLLYLRGFTIGGIIEASIKSINAVNTFHEYAAAHPELGYYPLLKSTAIRYFKILSVGAGAFVLAFAWKKLPFLTKQFGKVVEWVLLTGFAGLIAAVVIFLADKSLGFHYGPITSFLLGSPILILAYIIITTWRETSVQKHVLYALALAFFVLASLGGSGVWVSNFRHGVWLILPIVLLETRTFASSWFDFAVVRKFLFVGAIALGIALRIQMPYRDQPTYRLNTWFSSPSLRGIASSEGRTHNLEELLGEMQRRGIQPNDTVQAYPSMAMLYFVTKTIPWYKHPWIGQMWTIRQDLVQHQQSCAFPQQFPRYVVRGKFDPNTAVSLNADRPTYRLEAGYTPEKFFYGEYKYCHDCASYLDSLFLVQKGYTVIWENQGFALLQRQ